MATIEIVTTGDDAARLDELLWAAVAELCRMAKAKRCRRIHTIARNTSAGFFRTLGFRMAPGQAPEHPAFLEHGITFELMERFVDQGAPAGAAARRS